MGRVFSWIVVFGFLSVVFVEAQEPKKEPTPLPHPVIPGNLFLENQYFGLPHPATREVWQYYGVDGRGRFLPRVILSPSGSYYLYNHMHYPWPTVRTLEHMPYALD